MDLKLLGNRIKDARLGANLTLDDLASAIGVNKSTVSRYERGEIEKPKLPVIESIANALQVNPSWLIGKSTDRYFLPRNIDRSVYTPCSMFSTLKELRQHSGYSPAYVAAKVGISEEDYLSIEEGHDTRCLILVRLAELFCCSTDHLLSFDGTFSGDDLNRLSLSAQKHVPILALSADEDPAVFELVHKFQLLDDRGKSAVLATLNHEYEMLPGDKAISSPKEA